MKEITIEDVLKKAAEDFAIMIQTKEGTASRLNAIEWFKAGAKWAASLNRQGWTRVEVVGLLELLREQGWLHNPYVSNEEMINEYKSK